MRTFKVTRKVRTGPDTDMVRTFTVFAVNAAEAIRHADAAKAEIEARLGLVERSTRTAPPRLGQSLAVPTVASVS